MALNDDAEALRPGLVPWRLREGYGSGIGSVPAGVEVTVQAVVEPGTPGVGDDGTPTVLFTFEEGEITRSLTLPVPVFCARFEEIKTKRGGGKRAG